VLFLLFIKYISDKYAHTSDFAPPVVIPPGASFSDMLALRGKADMGDRINTDVIAPLVAANERLARSDFPDFNDPAKLGSGREMVDRLTTLINIFASPQLDFSGNRADQDDLLGDAYEYLMRHFAQDSGKSKGQFYTPAEVSRIIAKLIGIAPANATARTTAYDPTCGSGSLLLKVAAEAGKPITLEGQEKDVTTAGLARMNMILHGFPTASILAGNTLTAPKFLNGQQLRTYDYVVANPPFSDKAWSTGLTPSHDPFQRFAWGEPPAKQGDYAYLLHIIRSLKASGQGACILPHGVLFRGNAEGAIREQLVRSGYLKAIVGLPPNLFYGTGIPACILVLDKGNAAARRGIFMIDAAQGFRKDGAKNRLREQDIHRIVDTFRQQQDVPGYARLVPFDEIAGDKNAFNLNLPRYIDASAPEDRHDIHAHLNGGIPAQDVDALADYWQALPALRSALFSPLPPAAEAPGVRASTPYLRLNVEPAHIKPTLLAHPQFSAFSQQASAVFARWRAAAAPTLAAYGQGSHPAALIATLSESLLAAFRPLPLIDAYAIYQHFMDQWADAMQDDAWLVADSGWQAQPERIVETNKKGQAKDKGWQCDLVPKPVLVARHFAQEQAALDATNARLEAASTALAELEEEHGGEEQAFAGFDKITAAEVKSRIREIGRDPDGADELAVLKQWLQLSDEQAALKKAAKAQDAALDERALARYAQLDEAAVRTLVIDDQWLARLRAAVQAEIERVSQTLAQRLRELAERYATPLPQLAAEVDALAARVEEHLKQMGAAWQ